MLSIQPWLYGNTSTINPNHDHIGLSEISIQALVEGLTGILLELEHT
jgi:hypothetical protein